MPELKAKVVLVDIEGTTTSISFVHDVLFPYAKANVHSYLSETWTQKATKEIVSELQQTPEYAKYKATQTEAACHIDVAAIAAFVQYLIDRDLKVTALKTLQGLIWSKGYMQGELKGHVYSDVPIAFQTWRNAGLRIAVYSSGSVAAQQLIFGQSVEGNLLPHLSAHFDTHVGHKQQPESYAAIAESLQVAPQHVLFLTDVVAEAAAALAAGMQAVVLQRPGNAPLTAEQKSNYIIVEDFSALHALQLP